MIVMFNRYMHGINKGLYTKEWNVHNLALYFNPNWVELILIQWK